MVVVVMVLLISNWKKNDTQWTRDENGASIHWGDNYVLTYIIKQIHPFTHSTNV